MVIAHRGASGHCLENSFAAFRGARSFGAEAVELDVHSTSDGELVVHHDPQVPGLGPIGELRRHQLEESTLPNGEPMPFLDQVLPLLEDLEVWIEVKALPPQWDTALFRSIGGATQPSRCAVHSFDHRIIRRLHLQSPSLRLGLLSTSYPLRPLNQFEGSGATVLWQEASMIDKSLVAGVHSMGWQVFAWTVNDSVSAVNLAEMGVDGLCGNYPERLTDPR